MTAEVLHQDRNLLSSPCRMSTPWAVENILNFRKFYCETSLIICKLALWSFHDGCAIKLPIIPMYPEAGWDWYNSLPVSHRVGRLGSHLWVDSDPICNPVIRACISASSFKLLLDHFNWWTENVWLTFQPERHFNSFTRLKLLGQRTSVLITLIHSHLTVIIHCIV